MKNIKVFPKKKNKSYNVFVNDITVSQKMKNKGWLIIEKFILKQDSYKKLFSFQKFCFSR